MEIEMDPMPKLSEKEVVNLYNIKGDINPSGNILKLHFNLTSFIILSLSTIGMVNHYTCIYTLEA